MSSFIEKLWELGPALVDGTPHARELGMKFVAIDTGIATLSLPYNVALIGLSLIHI